MRQTFLEMQPVLPKSCGALLDIGSGLGGIDILLNDWYGHIPNIMLIDGADDAPVVKTHNQTFNSHAVSESFLTLNRVPWESLLFCAPESRWPSRPYDLIISLNSWCFHYAPEVYLDRVLERCHPATRIIVDVRRHKSEWHRHLRYAFKEGPTIIEGRKFQRKVFTLR